MLLTELGQDLEAYKPALSELQAGLDHISDEPLQLNWIEAYWLSVDADFSSAGFVGRALDGTRLYLEVHCDDDTPEREVKVEMKVLTLDPKFPAIVDMPHVEWLEETRDLNLWLADELRLEDGRACD